MYEILFVCTGNTCRSPMAERIMANLLKQSGLDTQVSVSSAGLFALTGDAMSPGAQAALLRRGIGQGETHKARRLTEEQITQADLVLTMTEAHKKTLLQAFPKFQEKIFTLLEYAKESAGEGGVSADQLPTSLDVQDPFGLDDEEYERAARQIEDACVSIIQRFQNNRQLP
ncbi:low molecular weight protein arginine phosphatase [Sulfoacidibacillus thermotolerans]|nr:low molecular weight protein arginine phosphatase [Sulfoacidibacillus thermotolerans]